MTNIKMIIAIALMAMILFLVACTIVKSTGKSETTVDSNCLDKNGKQMNRCRAPGGSDANLDRSCSILGVATPDKCINVDKLGTYPCVWCHADGICVKNDGNGNHVD